MELEEQILEMKKQDGRQERNTIFVKNLLKNTDFSNKLIAELADAPIEFGKTIRAKLNK